MSNRAGVRHVKDILRYKFRRQGKAEEWIGRNLSFNWEELASSFFGGSHELILSKRHYTENACFTNELASSGELTPAEHFQYIKFTLHAICDIYKNNPYAVYTSVFQNWLPEAGASFNHLHKQIVGLDEWGITLRKIIKLIAKKPDAFNEYFLNFVIQEDLIIAENQNAVCFSSFGERFPTIAILSKSKKVLPWELTQGELKDFSDLLHAIHAALGAEAPTNEEWFFTPRNSKVKFPWYTLIKWRLNNPAGFEGNTDIYLNTLDPYSLKEQIVSKLFDLRKKGSIADYQIGSECQTEKNALKYRN